MRPMIELVETFLVRLLSTSKARQDETGEREGGGANNQRGEEEMFGSHTRI